MIKAMKPNRIITFALAIGVCFFAAKSCIQGNRLESKEELTKMYEDLQSETRVLRGSYYDLQNLSLRKEDSLTKLLQETVKKSTLSATVFTTKTSDTATTPNVITRFLPGDTIWENKTAYLYPVYQSYYKDKFCELSITSNKDSATVAYNFYDQYIVTQTEKKEKFMGPKNTYINIASSNPNTHILDQSSYYQVKRKKQWKGAIAIGSFIGGVVAVSLIK